MKIKCWIDSHANIHSCKKLTMDIDEDDWNSMTDEDRDKTVYEFVIQEIDWGYEEQK